MQTLTVTRWDEKTQYATLSFPYNKRFTEYLKYGVRPQSYRRWNGSTKRWEVHLSKLPIVLNSSKRWFEHVDYRALPGWVQMLVAKAGQGVDPRQVFSEDYSAYQGRENGPRTPPEVPASRMGLSPYQVLHVAPTAPWEVIKASYKALCLKHHPDQGGSTEKLQEINEAFSSLEKQKKD